MSAHGHLKSVLREIEPITLAECDRVKLQERKDTKFILPASKLTDVLEAVKSDYRVLEIQGVRMQTYHSTYFDTPGLHAYLEHHNGYLNRTKIRIRDYVESELSFFELKTKDNHNRTVKARLPIDFGQLEIPMNEQDVVETRWKHGFSGLVPTLRVRFGRIMLANLERDERVTIDLDVEFELLRNGKRQHMGNLAIVEVKRPKNGGITPIHRALTAQHVLKSPMSKYCVGIALLEDQVKSNRFKPLLRQIQSIIDNHHQPIPQENP